MHGSSGNLCDIVPELITRLEHAASSITQSVYELLVLLGSLLSGVAVYAHSTQVQPAIIQYENSVLVPTTSSTI